MLCTITTTGGCRRNDGKSRKAGGGVVGNINESNTLAKIVLSFA